MVLSVRRLWQRQEQKALFLAADPAAQYFHQYFKWLFCSKGCILATQFEIILFLTRITFLIFMTIMGIFYTYTGA